MKFKRILAVFRAPIFEDEERTHTASLLMPILWLMITMASIFGIAIILMHSIPDTYVVAAVLLTFGTVVCILLVDHGRVKTAAVGCVSIIWTIVTTISWMTGGLTAFGLINYFLITLVAGLLLGAIGALIFAGVNLITIGVIMQLELSNRLPTTQLTETPIVTWLIIAMHFVFLTALVLFSDRALIKARARAKGELLERLSAEKELAASERRFRVMVENISDPILLLDEQAHLKYISPAGVLQLGSFGSDYAGRDGLDLIHPDDRDKAARLFERVLTKPDRMVHGELRVWTQNDQYRWVNLVATNRLDDPDLSAIVLNLNDITTHVLADERVRSMADRNHQLALVSKHLAEISHDYQGLLKSIVRQVGEALHCGCSITLLSDNGHWLDYVASYNSDRNVQEIWDRILRSERQSIGEGITGKVIRDGKAILVPKVDPKAFLKATKPEFRDYLKDKVYQTILVVPAWSRGQVIGALGLSRQPPGPAFTEQDLEFAQDLADRAALAISNSRLYNQLHQRDSILEAVAIATQQFMHSSSWSSNIQLMLKMIGDRTRVHRCYLYQIERDGSEEVQANLRSQWIDRDSKQASRNTVPLQLQLFMRGFVRWKSLMTMGEPVFGGISSLDEREIESLLIGKAVSFLHVPIFVEDVWWGYIGFDDCEQERSWSPIEVDALKVAAGVIGSSVQSQHADLAKQESERMIRVLGDNLPDGAIYQMVVTPTGQRQFNYISGGIEPLMGLTPQQAMDEPSLMYDHIHPEDRLGFDQMAQNAINESGIFNMDARILRPEGDVRWCQWRAASRKGEAGEVIWDGIIQDITLQKEAENAIRASNVELEIRVRERTAELEMANRELTAFSYSVSHDLRAPLRSIDGYSSLLLQDHSTALNEEGRSYLENIRKATTGMNALIRDLLEFSRLARVELVAGAVDLSALASEVLSNLGEQQPERNVTWQIQPELFVSADPGLMQVVMQNLIGNAWKFTCKQPEATIEFGCMNDGDRQLFYVRDNGIGFDSQAAERIFEPFEKLHTGGDFEGSGIGLATVRRIIERHGGKVWAQARMDAGATFYFYLNTRAPVSETG